MKEVVHIYNSLFRFESRTKTISYPIHKMLKLKDDDDLLAWILQKVEFLEGDHVLDAGCGTGHAIFYLSRKLGTVGTGISISEDEIDFATKEAKRLNLSNKIHFLLKDYNERLPGLYDKILAIESLKHSENLTQTLNNLLGSLKEGGTMVIADDFLNEASAKAKKHMDLWEAPSFTTLDHLCHIIRDCGDYEMDKHDLTELVPIRSPSKIQFANKLADIASMFTYNQMKRNLKTYRGALLLEELYKKKNARYLVLIIKRRK